MPSKKRNVVKHEMSPVLFLSVDGEPMTFFLRPGPVKRRLQPLITSGGGMLCNFQQPGAILLMDPEERGSIPETTAHWYVSTQYIYDCIEKDEQLNLEDYRLNPEVVQRQSARLNSSKEGSPGLSGGRVAYSPEDDAAILNYVSKHEDRIGGNRLWQEMQKQRVTCHSWQSMKYHYRALLAKKQSEVEEVKTTEEETKEAGKQESDAQTSSGEDAAPPQIQSPATEPLQPHSAESNLTQVDAPPAPAESTQPENVQAETSDSPKPGEPGLDPETDALPTPAAGAEPERAEPQTAEPHMVEPQTAEPQTAEPQTVEPQTAEPQTVEPQTIEPQTIEPQTVEPQTTEPQTTEPQTAEPQTTASPQKDSVTEESQDSLQSVPDTCSPEKPKGKQKASPRLEQRQRRLTRRQLELEASSSPEPYGKKLRSSTTSAQTPSPSPPPAKKTKSAVRPAAEKQTAVEPPPSKRARGESVAAVADGQREESEEAAVCETPQPDEESTSLPQKGEKKKEKRKLGILELATKEFEDESEASEDEAPNPHPAEEAATQPPATDPPLPPSDAAADPAPARSHPEPGRSLREEEEEERQTRAAGGDRAPEAARDPAAAGAARPTSRAHLFIFDTESQEDDSQSLVGDGLSDRQPRLSKDAAPALTQVQLEEDVKQLKELMKQTNQDVISVTKALLRSSGDYAAAQDLLLNPSSYSGPLWSHCDDRLLLSADPAVRQQLLERYGEMEVAKRVVFLELEG